MAEIYLATSRGPEGFEKEVVIKRVRAFLASDPGFVQMFIAEARLASRLNHANLVQIFDFDKHEDTYYLAMEYVRGHSLWDVRKKAREQMLSMRPALVAQIGAEVARGLHHAHRLTDKGKPLNLVHRDVTPHNVLLSYDGAVKLTDFGVAKAGNSQTSAGVLKGKFAYMSPEQSRGEPVDARTDVFALGIVLWEMLTGGRLFEGDSDVAVLRAVQQSAIAPPARLNPDVPPELDAIVMRALERDAATRYQTAQELERALASFVLQHAKSIDDTDLGAYLRTLFADELSGAGEGTHVTATRTPTPAAAEQPREPTVAMRKGAAPSAPTEPPDRPLSPDEDPHASTQVAERHRPAPASVATNGASVSVPAPAKGGRRLLMGAVAVLCVVGGGAGALALRGSGSSSGSSAAAPRAEAPAPSAVPASSPPRSEPPAVVAAAEPAPVAAPAADGTTPAPAAPPSEPVKPAADTPAPGQVVPAVASSPAPASGGTVPARAEAPLANGTLVLQVVPWANISIDGKGRGQVEGRRVFQLPAGSHKIKLSQPRGSRELDVAIEPGVTATRTVDFSGR
ncbi:MAG TPA: protein kinase [Myxococcaceae bacterium]|nr:protein kinase [Myxococcaceae bacterium]